MVANERRTVVAGRVTATYVGSFLFDDEERRETVELEIWRDPMAGGRLFAVEVREGRKDVVMPSPFNEFYSLVLPVEAKEAEDDELEEVLDPLPPEVPEIPSRMPSHCGMMAKRVLKAYFDLTDVD